MGELVRVILQSADIYLYVVRWVALNLNFQVLVMEFLNGVVDFRSVKLDKYTIVNINQKKPDCHDEKHIHQ